MTSPKEAALDYLYRGWSPIALCPHDHQGVSKTHAAMCGSPGKAPLGTWKEFQARKPTVEELQSSWDRQPAANVGVCMGPVSGIVGLDIDGEEGERLLNEACGEELPDTCEFVTPGGGRRLLFQIPAGAQMPGPTHFVGAGKHSGMSFLSHGSQTVMPPSRHASGGYYEWKEHSSPDARPLQPVPPWLIQWARTQNQKKTIQHPLPHTAGDQIREGERDQSLTRLAGAMRRHGATKGEILAGIQQANFRCVPPLSDEQVEKIADSVSKYTPAHVNPNRMPPTITKQQPTATIVEASTINLRQIQWLWPSWLPLGKLIVLDGDPGLGKSTMLLDLAARVSRGDRMPDNSPGIRAKVILATAEDGIEDTLGPRLAAAQADLTQISIFKEMNEGDTSRPLSLPGDIPALKAAIHERSAKLVIIDPLMAFLGANVDSCKDQDIRRCLHTLAQVAEDENVAILFLRHLNKAAGTKAIYRGGGSIGIIGAVRVGLLVAQDPDDASTRLLVCSKNNLSELPRTLKFYLDPTHHGVCRVVWSGSSTHKADDLLTTQSSPEEEDEKKDAVEFVMEYLAGGAQPSQVVIKEGFKLGIPTRTTRYAAKRKIGVITIRTGNGTQHQSWWQLPGTQTTIGIDSEAA